LSIRLIDAGQVSSLRSQSVYHGLAAARSERTPDSLILVSPRDPYVSIGFHQELEREVDVEFCRSERIPVVRREVGGGAVYLDENQLFTQWVMRPDRLPWNLEKRFALYARPLVATYRALGIPAEFRPVNDIQVKGRKIGGTGAAAIGGAEVMVGSLMFDFNTELMARVLKVSSEKMRDKIYQSLEEYMTTMKKELGETPDREEVKKIYLAECQETLGEAIEPGELSEEESKAIEAYDDRLASAEWLRQKGGLRSGGVTIHQDVWVGESVFKAPGGLIRVTARIHHGQIEDISLSGDFTFHPHGKVAALERALAGTPLEPEPLQGKLGAFYEKEKVQTPGVELDHWREAILALSGGAAGAR
jgi:lipoate-protein ligase A